MKKLPPQKIARKNPLFAQVPDLELISRTRSLAAEERRITAQVLEHLMEIEVRYLHLVNHSSLYEFCETELGYSSDQAHARIQAMRLLKLKPTAIQKVESGELSISSLLKVSSFLRQEKRAGKNITDEEKRELLVKIEGKSFRACQKMLGDLSPQALPSSREKILSSNHTQITFTADQRLMEDLEKIRALWGNQGRLDFPELFRKMAELVLKKLEKPTQPATSSATSRKIKTRESGNTNKSGELLAPVSKGMASPTEDPTSPGESQTSPTEAQTSPPELIPPPSFVTPDSRHIPEPTKREVRLRDQGRCTQAYANGARCDSRFALQFDHIIPWAYGGTHEADNLRLLCRAHHALRSATAARNVNSLTVASSFTLT
jgi:hypothetical protein